MITSHKYQKTFRNPDRHSDSSPVALNQRWPGTTPRHRQHSTKEPAGVPTARTGDHQPILIGDKNYYGKAFEAELAAAGITLLRPTRKGEQPRAGEQFFKPLRQIIESVNDTLKGQLDLEQHGGRTIAGVCARVAQRVLALTAAIWHNDHLGLSIRRSLTAYDH